MLARKGVEGMEMVGVRGNKWVSLHTKLLEHPSQMMCNGEGQNSSLVCYFG